MIACISLSRRIGDRWLLRNVSLRVEAGRILGIVGPSGCGKTTLLRLLALLDGADEGSVEFNGRTFASGGMAEEGVYPGISVVAQSYPLWPHLTLRAMHALAAGDSGHNTHWQPLGLDPLLDRVPAQLSAGQRQRAALALALAVRPKVLLLDEITSAQDVEHCDIIARTLRALAASGMTIVMTTHYLQFVSGVADEFAFLDNGSLVEAGPIAQLKTPTCERLRKFLFVG